MAAGLNGGHRHHRISVGGEISARQLGGDAS